MPRNEVVQEISLEEPLSAQALTANPKGVRLGEKTCKLMS